MDYKNNTYDAMLKQKKDMLDTYSNLADESFKNKGLNEQEFNLRTGRKIDNFYIDQEVSKQNEFDLENASEKGYELIDDSKAVLNKFRLRTDSVKIQQFDNAQKKRMSSSITLYKRQHEMVMRDDGLEEYDFEIGEKTNDKTFLIMVGIHNWGQAQLVKKDYGDHLMTNEFYRKHREMIDSLAPDLELDAESKKLDGRNIFGDVGFTEESVNALRKFYEGLQNNMGATLYDAVLASMYRLDTFDSASLGPDAVPQKFMETKALRDRMGAVGEFISLGVNAPGEIGSAIRRLKGYSEHNLEDPNNPNQAVKYAKDTDVLNYYFEICDHMHMALDSDLRSALEDGKITFNEATGFIHQVDEKGHLTNLGEQGTRLSAFYHIGRSDKNLRGKMSSQVLEEHRKKNITKEGSNAEIEHNRYLSMYMDSIYFNSAQKPDLGNDGYGITKTVLKLQATNKEKYDQNKEMIDNMVEDVKGLSASIDAVNNQMEFYKKLQEDIAKDSKDPAVLKFKNNPNLMAYVNIHLDNKRNNLLKLLARADGYLNAFTNIFLNNELSVEGMNIINQYNDENKYIDMSKSAVHIRKISQYYSLRNEERNNMILDKIKKKLGKDLTEDKEKELKLWIAGKQGELAINKLGLEGVDFYDVSADDLYDKLKPYSGILNGGEALSEDKILEDIPGKIIEITKEFQEVFNSFFGKINEFHFGVIKQNEVQNTMDQFIALHLKYDSLNKILARENGNLTLEDKIKQDIKENAGDKAVFEYDKNRKLINKQFTIVEDLLYEYRMGEVIKKIEMGAPIDSLYTQGEYNEVENNDIVGVIRLFDNRIKKNKRNNVVYARRDKKTLSDHVKKYYAIQCKRTNNSINNLVGGYKENEATTEKGNIYDNNLKLFTSRLRGYVGGSKETEQEEFGSESKALEAILSKKKKVNEEKKEDNNKENELEQNKNEKKEINIEDFEIIENEEKEEEKEEKEEKEEEKEEIEEENEEKDVERAKQEFAKCEKLISKYKNISETNKKKYNKKLSGESKIKENKKERLKILIDSQNKLADLIVLKDIGQMINIRAELMGKENKTAADEYLITEYSTYISKAISVTGQKNNMGQAPDNIDLAINDAEKTLLKEIVNSVVVGYDKETEKSISNLREELEKGTFIDLSEGFQTRLYTFVSTYYADSVQVKEAEDNKEQNKEQEPKEKQKANKEQIPKAEQEFNEYIEKLNNGSFSEKILAKVITEFQAKSVMNSKTNEILQKVNGENDKLISRTNSKEKFKRLLVADKITDIVNHAENLISSKRAEDYNYEEELDYINSSSFIEAIAQVNNGKIEDSDNFNINDQDKKILEIILDSINVDEAWTEESMVEIQNKMESGALEPLSEGVMNRLQAMMICYNISKQKSKNINVIKKNKINIDDFEVIEGEKKEEKKVEKKEENKKDEEKNEKNNNEEKKKDLIDEFDIIKDEEIKEVKKNQIIYNKDKFTDMGKTYGLKVEMPKDIVIKDKNSAEGIAMAEQIKNAEFMKNVFLLSSVKQFKNDKYWKDFVKKEPKTTWRYSYIQLIANGKVKLPGTKTIVTLNYNVIGNKEDDNLLKNIEAKDREAWAEFVKDPLKIQTSNGRAEVLDRMFKDPKFKGLETKKGSGAIDSVKYAGFMALYTEYIGNMISFQDKFRRNTLKEMHTQQLLNVKPINMNDKEMKIAKFDNFENQKLGLNCFAATGAYILNYWNKMKKEHAVRKTRTYTQDDFKSDTNLRVRNLDIKRYIQLYEKKNTLSEQQLKLIDWDLVNTFKEEYDNLSNYLDPEVSAVGNLFQLADMYLGHLKNVCVKKWNTQAGSLESIVGTDKEKQKKLYELLKIKVSEIMKANGNTPISFFRGSQAQNNSFMTSGHYVVITGINAKGSIMYYEPAYKIGQEIKEPLKEKELKPEDLLGLGNELELQWLEEMNQEQVDKIKKDYDMMGSEFEGNKLKNYEKVYEENMLDSANMIHNKGIVLTKKASKEESIDSLFGEAVYVPITLDDEEYQKVVRGVGKKVEDNKAILAKGKKSTKAKKVIKKKSDK